MSNSIDPISAKKALEALMHVEGLPAENPERDVLDREELRQAEYEAMGLQTPPAPTQAGIIDRLNRILRRRP